MMVHSIPHAQRTFHPVTEAVLWLVWRVSVPASWIVTHTSPALRTLPTRTGIGYIGAVTVCIVLAVLSGLITR